MRPALLSALLVVASTNAAAQQAAPSYDTLPITDAAPVVVTGVQPGPGMWKVSKGDHVMWVLGTVSPLPKGMQWEARDVRQVLSQAQEVVLAPSLQVSSGTGFFGTLALLPSLVGVRDNPEDRRLADVVPPASYARWTVLKQRYMPRKDSVEQWRPMFAAMELYDRALDSTGLARHGVVWPLVEKEIKARGIAKTAPSMKVTLEKPRAAIKEFKAAPMDDVACFDATLRRIETGLPRMAERANAWAVGDVDALRALSGEDNELACMRSAMGLDMMKRRGLGDADAKLASLWLDAAQSALERNTVTLALLPMEQVLGSDGYLARLAGRGYTVEAP